MFDFHVPIGWDELGVIATALAVIIALWANHQSKKQLISALQIQEQTKNIELLDKRICVIDSIENDDPVPPRMVKLLFSPIIQEEYSRWHDYRKKETEAEYDIQYYFELCRESESRVVTVETVEDRIREFESKLSLPDCPDSVDTEFREFCNNNSILPSETGKIYDYYELNSIKGKNHELACKTKQKMLNEMEKFLEDGIRPLS